MDWDEAKRVFGSLPAEVEMAVTWRHINAGTRLSCTDCPGAIAAAETFREQFNLNLDVTVGSGMMLWIGDTRLGRYWYEDDFDKFASRFDAGKRVKPATFTLRKGWGSVA